MIKSNCLLLVLAVGVLNSAYALDSTEQADIVSGHNKWRQSFNTPALKWSDNLAQIAQAYANTLTGKGCQLIHSHTDLGENLYWASAITQTVISSVSGKTVTHKPQSVKSSDVVDSWGEEVKNYNYNTNSCKKGAMCGHYSQLIWKDTREVGCAKAFCDDQSQLWVCNYQPAGNFVGQKPY